MIALDKQTHFLAGVAIAGLSLPFGIVAACLVPVAIGFAKEMIDPYVGGQRDPVDFAYTIAGAAVFVGWIKVLESVA